MKHINQQDDKKTREQCECPIKRSSHTSSKGVSRRTHTHTQRDDQLTAPILTHTTEQLLENINNDGPPT